MKILATLLLTMSIFTACQRTETPSVLKTSLPAKTVLNLPYGPDSLQRMDLYLPAQRSLSSTNVLVLIHGGGWASGDKSEFAALIPALQQRLPNYAVANINYRLASQVSNHFPTQELDIKKGLQTLLDAAHEYQVSTNFVLLGTSAGAHLALLQAYKHNTPVVPKAVVSFFGPTDMTQMYNNQTNAYYKLGMELLVGGRPATNPDIYNSSSPINFVDRQPVPTLLLHGGQDRLVPVAQSKALKEKLDRAGVPVQLIIYPAEGHGWFGATLTDSYQQIETFLKSHVPASSQAS